MRDEVERESGAVVRFEAADNQAVVSGQERNVMIAVRFLDAKAQDTLKRKDAVVDCGSISQTGTQSREVRGNLF